MGRRPVATTAIALLRSMRPRQWAKNSLVFLAPLAAGRLTEPDVLVASVIAFAAFSAVSSAIYLANDLADRERDRQHPTKKQRPIAAGELSARTAGVAAVLVGGAGLLAAARFTTGGFLLILAAYTVLSLLYSLGLKDQPVLDLAIVATGFVLRAVGGGVASGVAASQWLVLTTAAGALFVVAGKRASELALMGGAETRASLDGYTESFLRFVWSASATVTMVMAAVWAAEIAVDFQRPRFAQASVAPLVLGVLRYARAIDAGRAGAPEEVILEDRWLLALGALWVSLFLLGVGAGS
jgi:decaprenyl-phosphate phosphoribosyltransferase